LPLKPSTVVGALNGVTIIDLTQVLAGPYASMMLADMGARVIKVENPGLGDISRAIGPHVNGQSVYFASLNRGKQSIALDLKNEDDIRIFNALLDEADVLMENFKPGAMARLGYDWDRIHRDWPHLIYSATSGFGHTGPYSPRPAFDMVVQAMGGIMSVTGQPDGPPTRVGSSIGDIVAGLFTCNGVLSALHQRNKSGKGMFVDVAMLDSQIAILENAIARYVTTGEIPGPLGARHPSIAPFGVFDTADDPIVIATISEAQYGLMTGTIGRPDLATNPLFSSVDERLENVDVLKAELEATLKNHGAEYWLEKLEANGLPCGPLNNVAQALSNEQVLARNMVVSLDDPVVGHVEMAGNPIKISGIPDPATRGPVPGIGSDRQDILKELGLTDSGNASAI